MATAATASGAFQAEDGFPRPAYSWYFLALLSLAGCFAFIDRTSISVVGPGLQQDLGLSDSQLGLIQGVAFSLFYTLFGLPLGFIADRWNRTRLLTIGITAWSLMTVSCGFAASFGMLFLARLAMGAGEASLNPSVTSLVSDLFGPKVRARAFAAYMFGQNVGNGIVYIFGGMLLGWLVARGGFDVPSLGHFKPWQAMLMTIGLAGLIPAVLLLLTAREPLRHELADKSKTRATRAETLEFCRKNKVTLLCHFVGVSLTFLIAYSFSTWMPTLFLRAYGWQPQDFSVIFGGVNLITGLGGPIAVGWIMGRLRERGVLDFSWRLLLAGCVICMVFGTIAPLMPTPQLALGLYVGAGLGAIPVAINAFVAITEFVPNELRGLMASAYFLTNGLLSIGLGPFAVGLVTDYVLQDKAAIGSSLAIVSLAAGIPATLLLTFGLKSFRASMARAHWRVDPVAA